MENDCICFGAEPEQCQMRTSQMEETPFLGDKVTTNRLMLKKTNIRFSPSIRLSNQLLQDSIPGFS